jgi:pyruvate dehydrogenase E1 component beta subunit
MLEESGISAQDIDLRMVTLLDKESIYQEVVHTDCLLLVDEDYEPFGLSGELATVVFEASAHAFS